MEILYFREDAEKNFEGTPTRNFHLQRKCKQLFVSRTNENINYKSEVRKVTSSHTVATEDQIVPLSEIEDDALSISHDNYSQIVEIKTGNINARTKTKCRESLLKSFKFMQTRLRRLYIEQ